MIYVLAVQVATFVIIGTIFITQGQSRLGVAQLLLAAVQGVIYSGRMAT